MDGLDERTPGEVERLLDSDPDLASAIPADQVDEARRVLRVPIGRMDRGPWDGGPERDGCAGLLVLEGLLSRNVTFGGSRSRELLGPGDVLRPWDVELDFLPPYSEADWTVFEPTRVAILDRRLLALGARWPGLVDELIRRTMYRSRWLAVRLAIGAVTRVDTRLMLLFWHAAGRWGRMTPGGALVSLPLTHGDLGDLIGARRPSVSTAMSRLRERGEIEQLPEGWLLPGDPPSELPVSS